MRASFDATGETLVVTGGAGGIGAAVAAAWADIGGVAVVLDSAAAPPDAHAAVEHERVDVADRDAVLAAVAGVIERHGRVDALLAGAAVQPRAAVDGMDPEEWRRTLAVNLDGVVWAAQAVLPGMRERRSGSIVTFASGLANVGHAEASAYAASKAALVAWAKSLAAEVAADRVRVNVAYPGVVDTAQFRAANPEGGQREHWERTLGVGTPRDVVGPLLFLLSDAATMTGSILTRDRAFGAQDDG